MCGLVGYVIGRKRRTQEEIEEIRLGLDRLLVLSEHRGRYATGAAWIKDTGHESVVKAPMRAKQFVASGEYVRWRRSVSGRSTLLIGHTRYPTLGSHFINDNNQPLASLDPTPVIVAHNGHYPDVDVLFRRFGLRRELQVDSELLLRLAERHLTPAGIRWSQLIKDIQSCRGAIAAVFATPNNPDEVLFVRRERPLCLAVNRQRQLLAFASEEQILEAALSIPAQWVFLPIPPNRAFILVRDRLERIVFTSF